MLRMPPRLLAIEMSGVPGWVVLSEGDRPVAWRRLDGDLPSARSHLASLDGAWREAGWTSPPDLVLAGIGPGSYTGTRIACASVRALAYAWGVPAVPFDTFEAIAEHAVLSRGLGEGTVVAVARDARRGAFYLGLFRAEGGSAAREAQDRLVERPELEGIVPAKAACVADAPARGLLSGSSEWEAEACSEVAIARVCERVRARGGFTGAEGLVPRTLRRVLGVESEKA
jgi:tRNA threonylcarbamoyladenosine biosynthesis protein TsaB